MKGTGAWMASRQRGKGSWDLGGHPKTLRAEKNQAKKSAGKKRRKRKGPTRVATRTAWITRPGVTRGERFTKGCTVGTESETARRRASRSRDLERAGLHARGGVPEASSTDADLFVVELPPGEPGDPSAAAGRPELPALPALALEDSGDAP